MSSIDIVHPHDKTPAQARKAMQQAADTLKERFGIESHWEGDNLRFERTGVDGAIELLPKQVRVTAELGFLLSAMKGTVESEIRRVLADKLG
ncbi:polyhydroxyalkanoic acid system family protein [Stenotrophomonas sp. MMGLT7]|uniref:polyhydroxyalkanoic acid system family protein n=1 Tax=Stenotrophomonas sp. MMGLT7 TaxID=2901227 RepID=UPI001E2F7943|nr:polyhydroxyalkanoic acid system family protein [Stenotrophomonas sp. MMGLT7]MCD7097143.1 polyhydroxyalkanoic acid system family protein [Stenotrophomonas sp. MMGLT7]